MISIFRHTASRALLLAPLLAAGVADAASFSCRGTLAADEAAICADCDLAQLDVKMATLYVTAGKFMAMGARGDLHDTQVAWLARRKLCDGDVACLRTSYEARIDELNEIIQAIASRGPF